MSQPIQNNTPRTIENLKITAAGDALKKATGIDVSAPNTFELASQLEDYGEVKAISSLLEQLPPTPSQLGELDLKTPEGEFIDLDDLQGPTTTEIIESQLLDLSKIPGALEAFTQQFADAVFLIGRAKPDKIKPETHDLLYRVAEKINKIRATPESRLAPKNFSTLNALRDLDTKLLDFVRETGNLRSYDSVQLEKQHKELMLGIKAEQQTVFKSLPADLQERLHKTGIFKADELLLSGNERRNILAKLEKSGLIGKTVSKNSGTTYAFAAANGDPNTFEDAIPTPEREKICRAIEKELTTKYSGKVQPLGTEETRKDGVPTLLDLKRIENICNNCQVSEQHVKLMLKYLESHNLITAEDGGYTFTDLGKHAGLTLRAVRFIKRAQNALPANETLSFDQYLEAAQRYQSNWQMPTYNLGTSCGGAPWVYLFDELLLGNARIDSDLIQSVITQIQEEPDEALVIASNVIQGNPAVEPRSQRTSLPPSATNGIDIRDYRHQIKLASDLLLSLKRPVLKIDGSNELETANLRADIQRERDREANKGLDVSSEHILKSHLAKQNDIEHNANRKYAAKLHAEIHSLIANVIMPLEFKLGRKLMNSQEISEMAEIEMNEIEIVRDISEMMRAEAQGILEQEGVSARENAEKIYGEFLQYVDKERYFQSIEEILFPEKEELSAGNLISRGGAKVQLFTPDGKPGLKMWHLPEFRFGKSESRGPTDKVIELMKSMTASGKEVPDIVSIGSTGQPFFSQTGGGTAIVSADTFQSSNPDALYYFTESQDRHKRRTTVRGGGNYAGAIAFRGGVDQDPDSGDYYKTDAYTLRFWNEKIQDVLTANAEQGKESCYKDIYATSDFQTGSPTAKPSTWLRGLFWAIENEQKELLINGDVFQGQNYPREPIEAQLTGIIGIEDQQVFVAELLTPVLNFIKAKKEADPSWELPKWKITTGNHETNSQFRKGAQGIWFLQTVQQQIESFYAGAFGSDIASAAVQYPRKFVDREGTDVDYSHLFFDFTDEVGFRVGAQHYVGVGAKGSKATPPIRAAQDWGRSMEHENRPLHAILLGHWHTQSFTQADGIIYGIFGANAGGSGFERHLGYPTTVPASGVARFYSDRAPEFFFVTDPYLRLQEKKLREIPIYNNIVGRYGSLEEYIECVRKDVQGRKKGAASYEELKFGRHNFLETHRRL